jgi:protein gp37
MSAKSKIQWTQRPGTIGRTWNPVRGCSIISEGCSNCYAMYGAHRMDSNPRLKGAYSGLTRMTERGPVWTGGIRLVHEAIEQPFHWKEPSTVFVNSMSDLFHEGVPFHFISRVLEVIAKTPQHTYIVLTKRPQRMREALGARGTGFYTAEGPVPCPQPNLWLGVSVEHQKAADERIPLLLETPAVVRFLSVEPLLERVNLGGRFHEPKLDWIIVGGESGPRSRPCALEWVRSVVAQAQAASIPVFVKQLGALAMNGSIPGEAPEYRWVTKDRKGGDPAEWPEDLRKREWTK